MWFNIEFHFNHKGLSTPIISINIVIINIIISSCLTYLDSSKPIQ